MHISYYGKQFDIPDRLKAYAEQKLAVLEKLLPDVLELRLNIQLSHHHRKGEVYEIRLLAHSGGERFNVETKASDPYSGVDELVEKLERNIQHEQGKRRTARRRLQRLLSPRNMFAVSRRHVSRLTGHSRRAFGKVFRRRRRSGKDTF